MVVSLMFLNCWLTSVCAKPLLMVTTTSWLTISAGFKPELTGESVPAACRMVVMMVNMVMMVRLMFMMLLLFYDCFK